MDSRKSPDLLKLPPDLPVPVDDGACDHLPGAQVPSVRLQSTAGRWIDLADIAERPSVWFFYPRTGQVGKPAGPTWDAIPGARGCTPQSCGFRDLFREFGALGVAIYGVNTQETAYQREFVARHHVPFEILSDRDLSLTRGLRLPTFEYPVERGGPTTLIKRMAWYVERGRIERVWYPIFPPHRNAEIVLGWLRERARLLPGARTVVELA
jgi:peroxiredoxin